MFCWQRLPNKANPRQLSVGTLGVGTPHHLAAAWLNDAQQPIKFYRPLLASGSFCINLLRSPQVRVSQAFGGNLKAPSSSRGAIGRGMQALSYRP
jgi:hypothetical protein